jgi:hypothetical protein
MNTPSHNGVLLSRLLHSRRSGGGIKRFILAASLWTGACAVSLAQTGPIPASHFGQTFIELNSYSQAAGYDGNLGKEILGSWPYLEPDAPGSANALTCSNATKQVINGVTHCFHWAVLDTYVAKAKANNLIFQWTYDESPSWPVSGVGCSTPAGNGVEMCTGPLTDLTNFGVMIDALVSRYNVGSSIGTIQAYELGNEDEQGDYTGTPAQLATQFETMTTHVRSLNARALIVGIGSQGIDSAYCSGCYLDTVWAQWKLIPSNHAHLDAVTFHGYPHGYAPVPEIVVGGPGSSVGEGCNNVGYAPCAKAAISRLGITTFAGGTPPLYDTEGSWGTNSLTAAKQIAYIGRSLLLNWSAGVTNQDWYAWDNSAWGCISCQAANITAWKQVYNWMVDSTMTTCALVSGSTVVWTCKLTESSGKSAIAVWDTSGSSNYTTSAGSFADYRDLAGNTTTISSSTTSVPVGIQPILLETDGTASTAPTAPTGLSALVE